MSHKSLHSKSGFTIVEVMIAMAILFSVLAMSMGFLVESTWINYSSQAKNNINREMRNVVDRMALEAKQSNFFILYTSAANADRIDANDRMRPNESGDALLLVEKAAYAEMAGYGVDPLYDPRPIIRLILYYRMVTAEENGAEVGPVMRWEGDFSQNPLVDSDQIRNVEDLIPTFTQLVAESRQVVAFSEGLSDGRLFFNFQNRTAMINGKILHGNKAKWITDTYNFSISPRG
jgi:prepilin-type N-terminal cleavage/methylation domain-containing protein